MYIISGTFLTIFSIFYIEQYVKEKDDKNSTYHCGIIQSFSVEQMGKNEIQYISVKISENHEIVLANFRNIFKKLVNSNYKSTRKVLMSSKIGDSICFKYSTVYLDGSFLRGTSKKNVPYLFYAEIK